MFYIPFRSLEKEIPSITLHRNSENFEINEVGDTLNPIFIEEAYKKSNNNFSSPPDLMIFDNCIFSNSKLKDHLCSKKYNIKYQESIFIDNSKKYHEDYWAIVPTDIIDIIDTKSSSIELTFELDSNNPLYNDYLFESIIVDKKKTKGIQPIFIEPYTKEIVIEESILEFIKENKLTGLSFIDITRFQPYKMFKKNNDIINI
jgi:hypothetical protein